MATQADFFTIIGEINTLFSTLDFVVTLMLSNLISDNHKAAAVITNDISSLRMKIDLSTKLAQVKISKAELNRDFQTFCKKAQEFRVQRNRFVHDLWILEESNLAKGKVRRQEIRQLSKHDFKFNPAVHTLEELQRFSNELGAFVESTIALYSRMPGAKIFKINDARAKT